MASASFRYSSALIQLATEENLLDLIHSDFLSFIDAYKENKDLRKLLSLDLISKKKKKEIINNILGEKSTDIFKNFLMLLIDKNRLNEISLIFESFESLYFKEKNIIFATVFTANKLTSSNKKNLTNKLEKKYNKNIILTEKIDKNILGGLVLHIDGKIIDISIKSKLDALGNKLKQTQLS